MAAPFQAPAMREALPGWNLSASRISERPHFGHRPGTCLPLARQLPLLRKCADHDVVAVRIPERKLCGSRGGVHMRLLVESRYESASSL
jgi:hypothetical protein